MTPPQSSGLGYMLTMHGWAKYEELKKQHIDNRTAFMAMKFNAADVDAAVNGCFRPAVSRAGFELRILNERQEAGLIDDHLRAGLLAARFVISDLTHGSYGAYWEAGFGEGRGVPVIYTCQKSAWEQNKTHFDTTIIWGPNNLVKAQNDLVARIRATLRGETKQTEN